MLESSWIFSFTLTPNLTCIHRKQSPSSFIHIFIHMYSFSHSTCIERLLVWGTVFGIKHTKATKIWFLSPKGLPFFSWKCLSCPWILWLWPLWPRLLISCLVPLHFQKSGDKNSLQNNLALSTRSGEGVLITGKKYFSDFWLLNKYTSWATREQSKFKI